MICPCTIINEDSPYYGRRGIYCGPSATWPGMVRVILLGQHPSQDVSLPFDRNELVLEHDEAVAS